MQGVRSIASIYPYAEEKKHFLFAYDVPMTFQTHFCLTIIILGYSHHFLFFFCWLVVTLPVLFSWRSPLRLQE